MITMPIILVLYYVPYLYIRQLIAILLQLYTRARHLCSMLIQYSIVQYSHSIVQYSIVQYGIVYVQYSIVQYSIVQYSHSIVAAYSIAYIQYSISIVQYSIVVVQYSILQYSIVQLVAQDEVHHVGRVGLNIVLPSDPASDHSSNARQEGALMQAGRRRCVDFRDEGSP